MPVRNSTSPASNNVSKEPKEKQNGSIKRSMQAIGSDKYLYAPAIGSVGRVGRTQKTLQQI